MDLIFCLNQETLASKSFDWLVPPDDHHLPLAIALLVQFYASSLDSYISHNLRKCDKNLTRGSCIFTGCKFMFHQPAYPD